MTAVFPVSAKPTVAPVAANATRIDRFVEALKQETL